MQKKAWIEEISTNISHIFFYRYEYHKIEKKKLKRKEGWMREKWKLTLINEKRIKIQNIQFDQEKWFFELNWLMA